MKKLLVIVLIISLSWWLNGCASPAFVAGSFGLAAGATAVPYYTDYKSRKNVDLIAKDKSYGSLAIVNLPYEELRKRVRERLIDVPERPLLNEKKEEIGRIFVDEKEIGRYLIITIFRKTKNKTLIKIWKGETKPFGEGQYSEDKGVEKDEILYYVKKFGGKFQYVENTKIKKKAKKASFSKSERISYNTTVTVIVKRANLREGPSTKYRIIKVLREGDKLIAIQETGGGWVKVKGKGVRGYIYKKLIVPRK